jgi:hypothetical protein
MVGSQGCGGGAPPPLSAWAPTALDTDAWVDTCVAMGGVRIVYVAKHGCGFTAWRSNVSLYGYAYGVQASPYPDVDVAARLVESAKKRGIGYGFYYSVVSNAYANVNNGQVQPGAGPGQLALTQQQYEEVIIAHLTELYSGFGALTEVWFDGSLRAKLTQARSVRLCLLACAHPRHTTLACARSPAPHFSHLPRRLPAGPQGEPDGALRDAAARCRRVSGRGARGVARALGGV